MSHAGDELLHEWCAKRDAEAFRTIVERHAGMVYATCRRVLRDSVEAEDVTQECFEALVSTSQPPYRYLGPWLHRVATNLSLKRLRESSRRTARERQYADLHAHPVAPSWDDMYEHVDEAIARLPEKLRIPITAHFLEGMTQEAVAQQLGTSPPTVRYRIKKGLERIGADLQKRHITTGAGTLAVLLAGHLSEAAEVPSALTESLGRLALAQAGQGAGAAAGGWLAHQFLLKALIVAAIPTATIVATFVAINHDRASQVAAVDEPGVSSPTPPKTPETDQSSVRATRTERSASSTPVHQLAPLSEGVPAEFLYLFEPIEKGPGAVYGTITDPDGEPLAGARVTLFRMDSWWKHSYAETVTDANGTYEITDLPVSQAYWLTAVSDTGAASGYVALYLVSDLEKRFAQFGSARIFPGNDRPGPHAGQRCRKDLSISPFNEPAFAGRVLSGEGMPVEGALVATAGRPYLESGLSMNVRTDHEGRFAVHNILSPDNESSLVAYAKGYAPTTIHHVPPQSSGNEIVLKPAHRVSGTARLRDTNQPVAGKQVTLRTIRDHDPRNVTTTDRNGEFTFDGLAAKTYALSLTDTDAGLASIDALTLDLRETEDIDGIQLLVSSGATISGRVYVEETNEPIAGVRLHIGSTRTSDSVREAVTGPDGTYQLRFLPAGKYGIKCLPPENVVRHSHPMDQGWPGPGKEVEVGPEEQHTGVDFAFQGGVSVSGRVTDPEGNPVAGAGLIAVNSQSPREGDFHSGQGLPLQTSGVLTDQDGYYVLRGFSPSDEWTYSIRVEALGYARFESNAFQVTGDMADINFTLEPAAIVSGRTVTLKGEPLPLVALALKPVDSKILHGGMSGFSGMDGRFTLSTGVLPGEYYFEAGGFFNPNLDIPFSGRTMNPPIVVEGTVPIQGVRVVIPMKDECATLLGNVFAQDTSLAVSDARVEVAQVVAENGDDYGASGHFEAGPGTGEFRLTNVFPGTVTLRAWAEGYPKQEVHALRVKLGAKITDLRLVLRPKNEVTASIEGIVYVNGSREPSTGRSIRCEPLGAREESTQRAVAQDGTYRLEDLQPNRYSITAFSSGRTPDQLSRWIRLETVTVDAEPGFTYTQDFDLGGSCALRGRVDAPANAVNLQVTVGIPGTTHASSLWKQWPTEYPQEIIGATTRVDKGNYVIRQLPPGTYTVTASCVQAPRGQDAKTLIVTDSIILTDGQESTLNFAF